MLSKYGRRACFVGLIWQLHFLLLYFACEMSLGVSGKGVMHRSTINPTVRWGQDCVAGFLYVLLYIIKVEEMGKFQYRLAPHCSKLWTNTWGKKSQLARDLKVLIRKTVKGRERRTGFTSKQYDLLKSV